MPNGTYGGVRGKETKVGQKNFRFPTYSIKNDMFFYVIRLNVESHFPHCAYLRNFAI